jgi:hypothetical protein
MDSRDIKLLMLLARGMAASRKRRRTGPAESSETIKDECEKNSVQHLNDFAANRERR